MNRYKVFGGLAHIGPGEMVGLDAKQIKARKHLLEGVPKNWDGKQPLEVKAAGLLQFKVGEVIALNDVPRNLVGIVEPLDPPKSQNDEKAADHALRAQDPARHAQTIAGKRAAAAAAKAAARAAKKQTA